MSALRCCVAGVSLLLLAGCATPSLQPLPELPSTHPASPDAPQAAIHRQSSAIAHDEATRRTAELLNGAPKTDSSMPDMPGMNH
ncbi:MAG TPA: hypothetical protein VIT91_00955 [Chthoniobacterales bacterium]